MNLDHIYREQFGRAVATTARLVGDIGLAEDAVHDAFADALRAVKKHAPEPLRSARIKVASEEVLVVGGVESGLVEAAVSAR